MLSISALKRLAERALLAKRAKIADHVIVTVDAKDILAMIHYVERIEREIAYSETLRSVCPSSPISSDAA